VTLELTPIGSTSLELENDLNLTGLVFKSSEAVVSQQNTDFSIAADTTVFAIDSKGWITGGPNELIDKTSGANLVLADFAYSPYSRRLYSRSLILADVNDPVDLSLARFGSPTTYTGSAGTFPQATIYAAYIGTSFETAGEFTCLGQTITYTGFSVAASTTVAGTQTLNRDSTTNLEVASVTGFQSGDGVCRVGEHFVRYTSVATGPARLMGARLVRCGATTSYSATNGLAVSQHQFTGCSGGSGAFSYLETIEQNNYPVPDTVSGLTGVNGTGYGLGRLMWKPARNTTGVPPGSDPTGGMSHITAHIYAFTAEAAQDAKVGGNILFGTTPLQAGDPLDRMEITHDGSIRLGSSATIGTNRLDVVSTAKLHVTNDVSSWNALRLVAHASQSVNIMDVQSSAGTSLFALSSAGNIVLGDGVTVAAGTTTGTKIGTSSSQKLGFFGVTPVVQPSAPTLLSDVISAGRSLGLWA